ncbi:MAG TPA: hypothetical protein PLX69_21820 [Leptospiraceae bacterium]|nr:hypothetical protein [Leptospiraceae bacterium]
MKQMNLFIIILFCLATSVCAEKKEDAKTNNTEKVCCETFGYGARMIKCCQSYEMVSRDQCKVEDGLVGGGKQVVDLSFCQRK